jgi:hypothetical protein
MSEPKEGAVVVRKKSPQEERKTPEKMRYR